MIPPIFASKPIIIEENNKCQQIPKVIESNQDIFIKSDKTDAIIKVGSISTDEIRKIIASINLLETNPDKPHPDIKKLGKGGFGICYKFTNLSKVYPEIVVKKQIPEIKDNTRIFFKEALVLNDIDQLELNNIPKLVALFEKDNISYLVMNFMEGKPAFSHNNPLTKNHLKSLLNHFAILDKNNIIHDDLQLSNILVTPENANIIDFGTARKFTPDNLYRIFNYDSDVNDRKDLMRKCFNPYFPIPVNTDSFESRGLYFYLDNMSLSKDASEVRHFFIDYLKLKSDYHSNTVEILENIKNKELDKIDKKVTISPEKIKEMIDKAIEYEKIQAKVLKNPSDEIIDIEAAKIQLKFIDFRAHLREDHAEKIKAEELRYYNIIYFLRFREKINSLIEKTSPDSDEGKYYRNNREVLNNFSQFMNLDKVPKDLDIHDKKFDLNEFYPARAISEGKLAEKDQT